MYTVLPSKPITSASRATGCSRTRPACFEPYRITPEMQQGRCCGAVTFSLRKQVAAGAAGLLLGPSITIIRSGGIPPNPYILGGMGGQTLAM